MAHAGNSRHSTIRQPRLYTLTEVAESIKISMPTAQRYKKIYQERIPKIGEGRRQRYPREALEVFAQIKSENLAKRGRPRSPTRRRAKGSKALAAGGAGSRGQKPAGGRRRSQTPARSGSRAKSRGRSVQAELLTLAEISRRTKISYPTCINYVRRHLERIPHVGMGRGRRYLPEAVAVFRELRQQSRRRGPTAPRSRPARSDPALLRRIRELEKSQRRLSKRLDTVLKLLNAPLKVTIKRG